MTLSLYHTVGLALRLGDWPVEHLLYRAIRYFTRCVVGLLFWHLLVRFSIPMQRMLLQPELQMVVDSGADMHICHDRRKLLNYRPYHIPIPLCGAGAVVWCLGRGDMDISTIVKDGNDKTRLERFRLYGVWYVPGPGLTLLSTVQLRAQGIFYSSEKEVLYRKNGDCDVVVGETKVDARVPQLRLAKEDPTVPLSSFARRFWYDPQYRSVLPSWSWLSKHLFAADSTHGDLAVKISGLEEENDQLVTMVDSLKQKNAGLEYALSCQSQREATSGVKS